MERKRTCLGRYRAPHVAGGTSVGPGTERIILSTSFPNRRAIAGRPQRRRADSLRSRRGSAEPSRKRPPPNRGFAVLSEPLRLVAFCVWLRPFRSVTAQTFPRTFPTELAPSATGRSGNPATARQPALVSPRHWSCHRQVVPRHSPPSNTNPCFPPPHTNTQRWSIWR